MNGSFLRILPALALSLVLGFAGTHGAVAQAVSSCFGGGFGSGGVSQVTCRVSTGVSLTAPNAFYIVATSPAGTTTASCTARPPSGATVQGNAATVPATTVTTGVVGVGLTGCSFQVQSGSVTAGTGIGDVSLTLPTTVSNGTAIQLSTLVCSDPTCVALISSQQVSATVSLGGNGNGRGRGRGDRDDQCQYSSFCQTGFQYCNGSYIPPGQYCNSTGTQYCNGSYIPTGQYCNPTGVQYCNGVPLPPGAGCNSSCPFGQYYCSGGATVTYPAGWNIVAGPTGTVLPNVASPLYSFPPGAGAYTSNPSSSPLQAGTGYWAYFTTSTTVTQPPTTANTVTVQLTPNVYALIGNPSNGVATVTGAALSVLTFNPGGGYTPTTQLQPGQGAWVASPVGGPVTISSTASPLSPPAPPPPLAP